MWLTGRRKGRGKRGDRVEPHFGPRSPDLRAHPEERLVASKSAKRRARRAAGDSDKRDEAPRRKAGQKAAKHPRRSLIGRLAYWSLVLGVWGVIGLAGLFAYHASKLPPIDQLAVPKRPPNIAILSADGALLANRGDTGGHGQVLRREDETRCGT